MQFAIYFLTTECYKILLVGGNMTFILKDNRRETENKTVRFPLDLIKKIEHTLEGTEITFSRFVIQACEYALNNMEAKKEKEETKS